VVVRELWEINAAYIRRRWTESFEVAVLCASESCISNKFSYIVY